MTEHAFPYSYDDGSSDPGMTLRDYFAAKAMQAYLTDPESGFSEQDVTVAARVAYRAADAMLLERDK